MRVKVCYGDFFKGARRLVGGGGDRRRRSDVPLSLSDRPVLRRRGQGWNQGYVGSVAGCTLLTIDFVKGS